MHRIDGQQFAHCRGGLAVIASAHYDLDPQLMQRFYGCRCIRPDFIFEDQ